MAFILLDENNIVIQKQPNAQEGFIEAPEDVVCGYMFNGEAFVIPPPPFEKQIEDKLTQIALHSDTIFNAGFAWDLVENLANCISR